MKIHWALLARQKQGVYVGDQEHSLQRRGQSKAQWPE